MHMPSWSTLRSVAAPLAFGGSREQRHAYFAELHRVGLLTQILGIGAFGLAWLLVPIGYQPELQPAALAMAGMLASLVVRARCTTLFMLTASSAVAVLSLTFGLRTLTDGIGHSAFWVLPVGVFMTLAIAPIFNGALVYLAAVAGIWWIVGHDLFPLNAGQADETWASLMIAVSLVFGLALNLSFSLLRLRSYRSRQELMRLAYQDALTGLNNRRKFTDAAQQLHARPGRGPLFFMMIDIDNFKSINDRLGHDVGDAVLVRTAAVLAARATENGEHLCGRLGGEEFAVVYAGERDAACVFAGELVDAVYQAFQPAHLVSVSIGIAAMEPGTDLTHSYRLADEALYLAKNQGKNRYVIV